MVFKNQEDMPEQCPPANASANDVDPVFRYIKNEKAQEIDFQNHIEREIPYKSEDRCEAIALSFFTTEAAAKKLRRFKKFKKMVISRGKITSECGKHNIENNHINLWVYKNVDLLKVFLGEEDKGETN